jgi:hypothetical protein
MAAPVALAATVAPVAQLWARAQPEAGARAATVAKAAMAASAEMAATVPSVLALPWVVPAVLAETVARGDSEAPEVQVALRVSPESAVSAAPAEMAATAVTRT